jgi:hypothetical protein
MIGMDRHCQVVGASLAGNRPVDEETYASVAVLNERLERLRRGGSLFAGIRFSPHVERLRRRAEVAAVG